MAKSTSRLFANHETIEAAYAAAAELSNDPAEIAEIVMAILQFAIYELEPDMRRDIMDKLVEEAHLGKDIADFLTMEQQLAITAVCETFSDKAAGWWDDQKNGNGVHDWEDLDEDAEEDEEDEEEEEGVGGDEMEEEVEADEKEGEFEGGEEYF